MKDIMELLGKPKKSKGHDIFSPFAKNKKSKGVDIFSPFSSNKPEKGMFSSQKAQKNQIDNFFPAKISPKKKSPSLMNNLFPAKNTKKKTSMGNLGNFFPPKQSAKSPINNMFPDLNIKPRKNMTQKQYLNKTKRNPYTRFQDSDKDGVVNGIDCFPYDPSRHMAWAKGKHASGLQIETGTWDDNEPDHEIKRVLMKPKGFLKRQYEQRESTFNYDKDESYDEWAKSRKDNRKKIESLKQAIKDPNKKVPVPIEYYDRGGNRKNFQEGAHRGIAADELNEDMPVILARKKLHPGDRKNKENPYVANANWRDPDPEPDNRWDKEKDKFEPDKEKESKPQEIKLVVESKAPEPEIKEKPKPDNLASFNGEKKE